MSILKEEGTAGNIPGRISRSARRRPPTAANQERAPTVDVPSFEVPHTQTTETPNQSQMVAAQQAAAKYSITPQEFHALVSIQEKLDTRNSSLISLSNELAQAAPALFGGFEDAAEQWPTNQPAPGAFDEFEGLEEDPADRIEALRWDADLARRKQLQDRGARAAYEQEQAMATAPTEQVQLPQRGNTKNTKSPRNRRRK